MRKIVFILLLCLLHTCGVIAQSNALEKLSKAAIGLTKQKVVYDPTYFKMEYPNGDVPADRGVCTDVVIRAYRAIGIDLQREIHEDMRSNFGQYPKMWWLKSTDRNIDHRRVPNQMKYFERQGASLGISSRAEDYKPGDVVCWRLNNGLTHTGIVVNIYSKDGSRPMIVHNIGAGQVVEDILFEFTIIGHYRFIK